MYNLIYLPAFLKTILIMKKPLLSIFLLFASIILNAQSISIDPTTPFAACSGGDIVVNFSPSGGATGPFTVNLLKQVTRVSRYFGSSCNGYNESVISTLNTSNNTGNLAIPANEYTYTNFGICGYTQFGEMDYMEFVDYKIVVTNGAITNTTPFSIKLYKSTCPTILGIKTNANTYSAGSKVTVDYLTNGLNPGNQITFQLSDKFGSFTNTVPLNSVRMAKLMAGNATTDLTIPTNTPIGSGYVIKIISSDPVGSGITSSFSVTTPLPVTLINFTANNTPNGNLLQWQTTSETNSQAFEIQRSNDAAAFETIGKVISVGTSKEKNSYEFLDSFAANADIHYYRLKQIDIDGKYEYSKIISIKSREETAEKVFPNPFSELLTIENTKNKSLNIKLLNALGTSQLNLIGKTDSKIELNVKNIPTGIYFLQINDGENSIYKKIIKKK